MIPPLEFKFQLDKFLVPREWGCEVKQLHVAMDQPECLRIQARREMQVMLPEIVPLMGGERAIKFGLQRRMAESRPGAGEGQVGRGLAGLRGTCAGVRERRCDAAWVRLLAGLCAGEVASEGAG